MSAKLSKRATDLLALMSDPDSSYTPFRSHPSYVVTGRDYTDDGEWFYLYGLPNIGRKTINQLIEAGAIESNLDIKPDWMRCAYRLVVDEWRDDFGDLWVAA